MLKISNLTKSFGGLTAVHDVSFQLDDTAITGLVGWAATEHGIENFVMATEPGNTAAIALAAKLGFEKTAEHVDPEDGLEYIFVLRGKALARLLAANP